MDEVTMDQYYSALQIYPNRVNKFRVEFNGFAETVYADDSYTNIIGQRIAGPRGPVFKLATETA